jgi:hypothetical protein
MPKRRQKLWLKLVLSHSYLAALGEVISQWAYFETRFDETLSFLRMEPRANALAPKVPFSFNKRAHLFAESAKLCFAGSCPELVTRLSDVCRDATKIKKQRDQIAHCTWSGDATDGFLYAANFRSNKYEYEEITLAVLHDTTFRISHLSRRVMTVPRGAGMYPDWSFPLTSEEISAIRAFQSRYLPKLSPPDPALIRAAQSRLPTKA